MSLYDDPDRAVTLADILAPMTPETFFAEHYDRKPLHIPGAADKFAGLMDWDILTRLLNMTAIWSSKSLLMQSDRQTLPPGSYCVPAEDRSGNTVLQPDAGKVMDLLRKGSSLVANDIDTLTPELSRTADAFEAAFDAKVQVNLYCSWKQRQAFNSHFDTHDVFALHVEGEKVWRVYSTRMPHPIRHERHGNDAYDETQHKKQRGPLLMEVRMTPGDVLYLPRGWYHDALASSGGTVHMAFGVTEMIGFDAIGALSDFAVEDEAFRRNLPRAAEGREALAARLADLGERLQELSRDPRVIDALAAYKAAYRMPRMGIALPVEVEDYRFALTGPNFRIAHQNGQALLVHPGGAAPIPPGGEPLLAWILERGRFVRSDYIEAHGAYSTDDLDRMIRDLVGMNVLARTE
jgi:ribosomal protein L16 Arg81 hydroxylase